MSSILILSDALYRSECLAATLRRRLGSAQVQSGSWPAYVLDQTKQSSPDVILLDLPANDPHLIRSLKVHAHGALIIALGVDDHPGTILELIEAGISSYVPRNASVRDLTHAIEDVLEGGSVCDPLLVKALIGRVQTLAADSQSNSGPYLTPREIQIATRLKEGWSNQEIADDLCIQPTTVRNHVHSILEKLRVHRRAEAAVLLRDLPG